MKLAFPLTSGKSGRDFFTACYNDSLEFHSEWLARTARQKADSIEALLRRNGIEPATILELGCGTGGILSEIQRRGLASEYYGVDYSQDAIDYLKSTAPDVHCTVADIMETPNPFARESFDVVVLSHVLEHLEEPLRFLSSIHRMLFEYLLVEVPLEDLLFKKLIYLFKDRSNNLAGHVQFFNPRRFRNLLAMENYSVVDERIYAPWLDKATLQFAYGTRGALHNAHKLLTEHYLPRLTAPLWIKLYYAHCAILCQKADMARTHTGAAPVPGPGVARCRPSRSGSTAARTGASIGSKDNE